MMKKLCFELVFNGNYFLILRDESFNRSIGLALLKKVYNIGHLFDLQPRNSDNYITYLKFSLVCGQGTPIAHNQFCSYS